MALLQISEPGKGTLPHEHRLAVGIDLGTTNSLIASVISGKATILEDTSQTPIIPSIVHYGEQDILVGHEAEKMQLLDPKNTVASVKRLMGKDIKDINPNDFTVQLGGGDGTISIHTQQGIKNPVETSALILKNLKELSEKRLGGEIIGAVITVPAYFDDAQRQATKDAAKIAGINVLRLINEPTAAAVAYGLDKKVEGNFVIYDLGGGTFDISILRLEKGLFEVLATHGDSALGGDDFDHIVEQWMMEDLNTEIPDIKTKQLIKNLSRKIKEGLTEKGEISIDQTFADLGTIKKTLSREKFASLSAGLTNKTITCIKQALHDANLTTKDITGVVMVGGSTRMPIIQFAVEKFVGMPLLNNINPDEVVALGAAEQANILAGNTNDELLLLDVIPLSLGIETMGDIVERIIPRNSTLPVAMGQEFTTYQDGQTGMVIHVVQGERDLVKDCRSLGKFTLKGIPPMVAGAAKIRVTFQVDADGLLSVKAKELSTGIESSIEVKPSYGLEDKHIQQMLESSFSSAEEDKESRALAEIRVDGKQIIAMIESALEQDKNLLNQDEIDHIYATVHELTEALTSSDRGLIEEKTKLLNEATATFAARRMDNSISKALTGKTINTLEF
ncbi:Fe-S protein assembly chaperone HscA [Methylophilaceae bacterium]|nr:Fe-S protein assembly chaperone HscA [Methylophilaceae bacterium]MDC1113990.1 Fe-S protein assembly chaperone HscA [Methylophilaceae bacterium]